MDGGNLVDLKALAIQKLIENWLDQAKNEICQLIQKRGSYTENFQINSEADVVETLNSDDEAALNDAGAESCTDRPRYSASDGDVGQKIRRVPSQICISIYSNGPALIATKRISYIVMKIDMKKKNYSGRW